MFNNATASMRLRCSSGRSSAFGTFAGRYAQYLFASQKIRKKGKSMARVDTRKLYQNLIRTELSFVPRGRHRITCIYDRVRSKYPNLCDDSYLCSENCKSGADQPEWKHIVRGALDALKENPRHIKKEPQRGFWMFD